jgi:hypothetical protein
VAAGALAQLGRARILGLEVAQMVDARPHPVGERAEAIGARRARCPRDRGVVRRQPVDERHLLARQVEGERDLVPALGERPQQGLEVAREPRVAQAEDDPHGVSRPR